MLNVDPWNLLWTLVNLLVLYLVFKKFLFQPVMSVIGAREEMIAKQFKDAQDSQDEAENLKNEYQEKLAAARTEADQIVLEARARAEAEHEKMVERTKKETEDMRSKAKKDIANERELATEAARTDIARLAMLAARKIVKMGDVHDTGSSK